MSSPAGRRIELWVEARGGRPAINPVMLALLEDLADAGAVPAVRVLEQEIVDPGQGRAALSPDLVLLKTATTLALSVAVADEALGVPFLNAAHASLRAHDKAATVARQAAAGLPVPTTFLLAPTTEPVVPPRDTRGEWVSKPTRGVHGRGVAVHPRFPRMLDATAGPSGPGSYVVDDGSRLLQRRVGGDAADVKVYVAGDWLGAGRKAFGPDSYATDRVERCSLDRATVDVVRGVGEALGLRCFGVDLRLDGERAVVIDANPFPGYRGFPDAVAALRSEIERALELSIR
jgi:ribosomal protein S6--L-glutamate ligase